MKIDLHMHSTLSDGRLTPTELVRLLEHEQVAVAALTDHDSTEGVAEALAAAERVPGLRLVSGIEISASHPDIPNAEVHVLGYFVDHRDEELQRRLTAFRQDRDVRGRKMVERLGALGYPLEWERVKEIAGDAGVGRPHIAHAMVERGHVAEYRQAFGGLLNDGGAAYVGQSHLTAPDAAEMIRAAGGAAVLAHPLYVADYRRMIPRLAEWGFTGIEAHYAKFTPEERKQLLALAAEHDLLPCGGSDFHGIDAQREQPPGSIGPPPDVFEELERRAPPPQGSRRT